DPTTAGDFLVRFGNEELEGVSKASLIPSRIMPLVCWIRKEVATIDSDSSIHEVYGKKKEGADYAYDHTYSKSKKTVTPVQ
ncbi:MAG: hypothetical protein DRP87_13560, partial [Spirochaetes bacterium]